MRKLATFAPFLVVAVLAAGAFGALHNQISYTVSGEYFTKFKFLQFHVLNPDIPARVRASEVGFLASWWMGVPLGLLSGAAGFIHPSVAQMRRALFWSLSIMLGFTLICALIGLLYGYSQTEHVVLSDYFGWYIPANLEYPRSFLCAGYMHNAAYLGGVLAIPVAWVFHIQYRRHASRAA